MGRFLFCKYVLRPPRDVWGLHQRNSLPLFVVCTSHGNVVCATAVIVFEVVVNVLLVLLTWQAILLSTLVLKLAIYENVLRVLSVHAPHQ
jgi:hypothetical protein